MTTRNRRSAEFAALFERLPENDQRAFFYMLQSAAEAERAGEILSRVDAAQAMLDAARDTRNDVLTRNAEEGLERAKREAGRA